VTRRLTLLLPLLLLACGEENYSVYQGYAEGEYVRVASPYAGRLTALNVQRGSNVSEGAPLFSLEQENEAAARREVEAKLKRAQAQLEDLTKGRRPPEVQAVKAQLEQARASVKVSEVLLRRREELVEAKAVSKQELDEARAAYERDRAQVAELSARLATTRLPAREDEISAAQAEVNAQKAALAQANWRLEQKSVSAPQSGLVNDTLFVEGEWVAAGAPVVSILPPQNIHVRFFVPEPALGAIHVGDQVSVRCDGCEKPISATVSFIAPEAEFTPPVIYSRESRYKLVYLVRARPLPEDAVLLHPGQPVEVTIAQK
jgi:HlyD family secretion protein